MLTVSEMSEATEMHIDERVHQGHRFTVVVANCPECGKAEAIAVYPQGVDEWEVFEQTCGCNVQDFDPRFWELAGEVAADAAYDA